MKHIKYSEDFYVNSTSSKDIEIAKKYIETFVENMPSKLQTSISHYKEMNIPELEWQAVILGDYESKIFSTGSAGVFLINTYFIAYTEDRDAFFNRVDLGPFGYATYGNNISVELKERENRILVFTSLEKKYIAVNSRSVGEDYRFVKDCIKDNTQKMKELLLEAKQKIELKQNNQTMKEKIDKEHKSKLKLKHVDPRFKTQKYIISNNPIPKGFVFYKPVAYSAIKAYGLSNLTNPERGYLTAYEACISSIKQSIDNEEFDAVFNLKYSVHNVEGNYEVVMFGDSVVIENIE